MKLGLALLTRCQPFLLPLRTESVKTTNRRHLFCVYRRLDRDSLLAVDYRWGLLHHLYFKPKAQAVGDIA